MPAIDKELRERIERWQAGGYADASPALVDALISALEAAAPVAEAVAWVHAHANYAEFDKEEGWEVNVGAGEWGQFSTLPAAVAALSKRIEGDKP